MTGSRKPVGSGIKFTTDAPSSAGAPSSAPNHADAKPPAVESPLGRAMSGVGAISNLIETARTAPRTAVPVIDPGDIDLTEWADRHEDSFRAPEYEELKDSIRIAGGNLVPIKVRVAATKGEGGKVRYELIYGSRRARACRELGVKVKAIIEPVDNDRNLYVQMISENRGRQGLSPYEQGMSYHRAIRRGLFKTQAELVAATGLDQSNTSKAMRIAELPPEVVTLFKSPVVITFKLGSLLTEALKDRRDAVLRRAAELRESPPPEPERIVAALVAKAAKSARSAGGRAVRTTIALPESKEGHLEIASDGSLRVQLPKGTVQPDKLQSFARAMERLLASLEEKGTYLFHRNFNNDNGLVVFEIHKLH